PRRTLGQGARRTGTRRGRGRLVGGGGRECGGGDSGGGGPRRGREFDAGAAPAAPAGGAYLRLAGQGYPAAWDVVESFGIVSAEASTYLSLGQPATATLALRAGGASVRGVAPLNDAVYVGGGSTVRGYAEQRFAGRSGAYGNAELRVAVGRLSAGDVGVFGLADGGRVWISGESSDRWHGAAGGGVWFAWHH